MMARLLEQFLTTIQISERNPSEPVDGSKKCKLVLKDLISSLVAKILKLAQLSLEEQLNNLYEEVKRFIHDAVMCVNRAFKASNIVPRGGAIEIELSKYIRKYAMGIAGKEKLVVSYLC
jgi:chaperonin GroEL (HSP60 family)